jgi:hypothetical protein
MMADGMGGEKTILATAVLLFGLWSSAGEFTLSAARWPGSIGEDVRKCKPALQDSGADRRLALRR